MGTLGSDSGVDTEVTYSLPPPDGEQLYFSIRPEGDNDNEGKPRTNVVTEVRPVHIQDLHSTDRKFNLSTNGFELHHLDVPEDVDWNSDQVEAKYYPLAEELLKQVTGASRVLIFDKTIRNGKFQDSLGVGKNGARTPVPRVHVDYTLTSGPQRLEALLPKDEVDRLRKTPFAVIQVWRPIKGPVNEAPLAVVDAQSISKDDLMENLLHFPTRTGHTYSVKYNPGHQFWYAKGMGVDEALVFKCYDSRSLPGLSRFAPHTAFKDPNTPADAAPRESIEIRAYVFWENEPEQPIARHA